MFFVILLGWPTPLLAIQLLWINLVTDSFPAVALGMDPGDKEVMKERPRSPKESFFSGGAGKRTIIFGFLMGVVTIVAFACGFWIHDISPFDKNISDNIIREAQALAFITLVFTQMFFVLSIRSEYVSIFSRETLKNKYLIASVIIGILLQILLMEIPVLQNIFKLANITGIEWIIVIGLAIIPTVINEIRKIIKK